MITEQLTRPLGPLAVWQWGLVVGGGYVAYHFLKGGGSSGGVSSGGGTVVGGTNSDGSTGSNIVQGPQGEPGPPGPPGTTTVTNTTNHLRITLSKATPYYDSATGKLLGTFKAGTGLTVVRLKVRGVWEYVILSGTKVGSYVKITAPYTTNTAEGVSNPATAAARLPNQIAIPEIVSNISPAPSTTIGNQALKSDVIVPVSASRADVIDRSQVRSTTLAV